MIIGITGRLAAGKGEVAEILKQKGFEYTSLSDYLRQILKEQGKEITREALQDLGNELRKRFGPHYIAMKVAETLNQDKHYIVDSIRNPTEVAELRKSKGFVLLGVTADDRIRCVRIKERCRESDPKTFKEFIAAEKRENTKSEFAQQLDETFRMADFVIQNNGSLEELKRNIEIFLDSNQ